MRIDLHTHSSCSDGTQPPADVVRSAAEAGLDVVALTDHDTLEGWTEAAAAARALGVTLVPGVEISCRTRDGISVHLLGYLPDPDHGPLAAELARTRDSRVTRLRRMVELIAADHPIGWEQVHAQAVPGATLGRPHVADALVAAGVVADRTEAFAHLLHNRGPYHVSHHAPDAVEAVRLVAAAGGVAVMAHPFAGHRGRLVADEVVEEMAAAGLAGLEADHRDHDPAERERARALARRLGLLVTGSSDYHGSGKPNRLGENLTEPAVLERVVDLACSPTRPVG